MENLNHLAKVFLLPSDDLLDDLKDINGNIMILGAGGKMGPDLAILAKKAFDLAGKKNKVIAVSRFSNKKLIKELKNEGIEIIQADLLDQEQLFNLPEAENIIYMAGTKFGTMENKYYTWAMNSYLPGKVAEKFKNSRIVVFSTGNIYPFVPIISGGATEKTPPEPVGEYAQSCLGRERVFEYLSNKFNIPVLIFRLNYATDFTYGVLLEIARAVKNEEEIDLTTGHVNVIWKSDANEYALRSLKHCNTPPFILNVTGPEQISVRWLATEFGEIFRKEPKLTGEESSSALLNNASKAHYLFGYPKVTLKKMIELVAIWLEEGGETLNKPTHFQERKGAF